MLPLQHIPWRAPLTPERKNSVLYSWNGKSLQHRHLKSTLFWYCISGTGIGIWGYICRCICCTQTAINIKHWLRKITSPQAFGNLCVARPEIVGFFWNEISRGCWFRWWVPSAFVSNVYWKIALISVQICVFCFLDLRSQLDPTKPTWKPELRNTKNLCFVLLGFTQPDVYG